VAFDLGTSNLGIGVVDLVGIDELGRGCMYLHEGVRRELQARGAKYATTSKITGPDRVTDDDLRRMLELRVAIVKAIDASKPDVVAYEAYRVYDDKTGPMLRKLAQGLLDLFRWGPAGARPEGVTEATLVLNAASSRGFVPALAVLLDDLYKTLDAASDVRGRGDASKVLVVQGIVLSVAADRGIPVRAFLPSDLKERFHPRDASGKLTKSSSKRDHKKKTEAGVRACLVGLDDVLRQSGINGYQVEHVSDALGHAILGCEAFAKEKNQ